MATIKCLSLWQPWATLLIHGKKRYETRSWKTAHTGRILIHAARAMTPDLADLAEQEPFRTALRECGFLSPHDLPRGVLLSCAVPPIDWMSGTLGTAGSIGCQVSPSQRNQ